MSESVFNGHKIHGFFLPFFPRGSCWEFLDGGVVICCTIGQDGRKKMRRKTWQGLRRADEEVFIVYSFGFWVE